MLLVKAGEMSVVCLGDQETCLARGLQDLLILRDPKFLWASCPHSSQITVHLVRSTHIWKPWRLPLLPIRYGLEDSPRRDLQLNPGLRPR